MTPPAEQPEISVVIPTRGRETRLAFALGSLAIQSLAASRFEVIVVRDSRASEPLSRAPAGLEVRFERSDDPSPSAMRNQGWRVARADQVAFLDDDCRPSPRWLEALLRAVAGDEVVLQGRTAPDPDERHLLVGLARTIDIPAASGLYESCNIVYPRALLEQLGGFDEDFELPHWGEDTDLGLRARDLGAELRFVDDALAWHAVHSRSLLQALRDTARRRGFAQLLARHPELRDRMPARVFVKPSHALISLGIAGSAVAAGSTGRRRALTVAVSCLPYLGYALGNYARGGQRSVRGLIQFALHLPRAAAVDAAETLQTGIGGVRHRTSVL